MPAALSEYQLAAGLSAQVQPAAVMLTYHNLFFCSMAGSVESLRLGREHFSVLIEDLVSAVPRIRIYTYMAIYIYTHTCTFGVAISGTVVGRGWNCNPRWRAPYVRYISWLV